MATPDKRIDVENAENGENFEENFSKIAEEEGAKFRLTCRRVLLTYKGHLDKNLMRDFICAKSKSGFKEFYVAHEEGDNKKTPYEHTHVVVWWNGRIDVTNSRWLDVKPEGEDVVHPNIRLVPDGTAKAFKLGWIRAVRYLGKEDPENVELRTYMEKEYQDLVGGMAGKILRIQSAKTITEAFSYADKFGDICGVKEIFNAKNQERIRLTPINIQLQPWQKQIFDELREESKSGFTTRHVKWIYDQRGGKGKTVLTSYLEDEMVDEVVCMDNTGRIQDVAQNLMNCQKSGVQPKVIILDLSRQNKDKEHIYNALESLANGRITATKYQGGQVRFLCQHLVVFANFLPIVSKMSLDRWKIRELVKEKGVVSIREISTYSLLSKDEEYFDDKQEEFIDFLDESITLLSSDSEGWGVSCEL